ncbi:MAG: hypothetical protein KF878_00175 [Planctomycetes bacterium]|nr:hypothetical protein [Planctomycetota bacterium]
MPLATMTPDERQLALDGIELAAGPEGAAVDLDRALELRGLLRRRLDDAGWQRAWLLAARIIVTAHERRGGQGEGAQPAPQLLPVGHEPLVLAAARALEAQLVCGPVPGVSRASA